MFGYLARRLAMTLPTLLLVAIAVFTLVRLIPGDPVQVMLGDRAEPSEVELLRQQLGLDRSIPVQFAFWLARLITGDFGHSITNGLAVLPLILDRFQVSAIIVLVAVLAATLIAVPAGLIAAWRQNSALDLAVVGSATLLLSIPSFWLGLLLLLLF
jgi:peptide/nickel transport system permease protein